MRAHNLILAIGTHWLLELTFPLPPLPPFSTYAFLIKWEVKIVLDVRTEKDTAILCVFWGVGDDLGETLESRTVHFCEVTCFCWGKQSGCIANVPEHELPGFLSSSIPWTGLGVSSPTTKLITLLASHGNLALWKKHWTWSKISGSSPRFVFYWPCDLKFGKPYFPYL